MEDTQKPQTEPKEGEGEGQENVQKPQPAPQSGDQNGAEPTQGQPTE